MKTPIERRLQNKNNEIIVVKLWETFLRTPSGSLQHVLTAHSIDEGPFERNHQRMTFRFSQRSWEEKVKALLYENRIPVVIQSNPLYAMRKSAEVAIV